jgi:monothiol glutaredoxin
VAGASGLPVPRSGARWATVATLSTCRASALAHHAPMAREILTEDKIHPAIREKIEGNRKDIVDEVKAAVAAHDVVVVGMGQNPFPKKARKALTEAGIPFHYLEYGNYMNTWRRRNALKMWSGWPTFPMIFVKGIFIGGFEDMEKLIASGELRTMLG